MINRSKFIVTIVSAILVTLIAFMLGGQRALVSASYKATAEPSSGGVGLSQFYAQHNLVSDGFVAADHTDPNLVNAWGLAASPTSPWWIADNGTGKSTLYNVATGAIPAVFTVPGAGGAQGNPTGLVFNGGTGFVVNNGVGSPSAARFIFSSEDGTLSAFKGAPIVTVVPNAQAPAHGAIYKGLAIDSATAGSRLYATDFHNGNVDIFDNHSRPGGFSVGLSSDTGATDRHFVNCIHAMSGWLVNELFRSTRCDEFPAIAATARIEVGTEAQPHRSRKIGVPRSVSSAVAPKVQAMLRIFGRSGGMTTGGQSSTA